MICLVYMYSDGRMEGLETTTIHVVVLLDHVESDPDS